MLALSPVAPGSILCVCSPTFQGRVPYKPLHSSAFQSDLPELLAACGTTWRTMMYSFTQYNALMPCMIVRVLKYLGPRTKGSAALARATTLLQKNGHNSDLAQLVAASIQLPPEHCKWSTLKTMVLLLLTALALLLVSAATSGCSCCGKTDTTWTWPSSHPPLPCFYSGSTTHR